MVVVLAAHRRAGAEVLPEPLVRAVVAVAQRAHDLGELGDVAVLVQRVAGVAGEPTEEVGTQHRRDEGTEAAARLAGDAAVLWRRQRAVARVDERDDLVAQIAVVAAGRRRVDELRAAVRRPGVDVDDDARRDLAGGDLLVGDLGIRLAERRAVAPHRQHPGVALEHVHRRVAGVGAVVPGRDVHPQRALVRVAERVVAQQLAVDQQLVDASGERVAPRQHGPDGSDRTPTDSPPSECGGPSRRRAPSTRARCQHSGGLRRVIGVDADVAGGEVAAPDRARLARRCRG